jgi:hypothetical protein
MDWSSPVRIILVMVWPNHARNIAWSVPRIYRDLYDVVDFISFGVRSQKHDVFFIKSTEYLVVWKCEVLPGTPSCKPRGQITCGLQSFTIFRCFLIEWAWTKPKTMQVLSPYMYVVCTYSIVSIIHVVLAKVRLRFPYANCWDQVWNECPDSL